MERKSGVSEKNSAPFFKPFRSLSRQEKGSMEIPQDGIGLV
jgi:hypothetical protein